MRVHTMHDDSFATPADATHADQPAPKSGLRLWRDPVWMTALLLATAAPMALRAWMNFRTPIPGGVDAGYYAVQARELLQHGKLAWTDVPLIFALDAAIAKLVMIVLGWSLDDAVLWASRVVDSVGQPLVALSIFAGAFAWSRGRRSAIPAAIAATLVTTVTSPILRMVGDFEKQSLAMVFMATAWIALARALASADARQLRMRGAWAVGFFVLTALTHAGTFGAAAMGAAITLVAWAIGGGLTRSGVSRARIAQGAVIAVVVGAALLGAVWLLAPLKAKALMDAPVKLFGGGERGMRGPGGPGGPGGAGGPGGGSTLTPWLAAIGVCAVAIGWTIRRARPAADAPDDQRRTALADGALAIGLAATAAFLACPLIVGDYAIRLAIMAPLPLALVLAYVLASRSAQPRAGWWRAAISPVASVAVCVAVFVMSGIGGRGGPRVGMGGPPGGMSGGPQMITADGLAELRNWREELAARGTAVVAARHGLEFWAAFALNCAGRQSALKATDFDRYEHCYMLVETRGGGGGDGAFGGPVGFGGPPRGRPGRGGGGFDESGFGGPPPNDDSFGSGPPPRGRPMIGEPPMGGPPMGGPMMGGPMRGGPMIGGPMQGGPMSTGPIPRSATMLKRGAWFTLYEVPASARDEIARDGQQDD